MFSNVFSLENRSIYEKMWKNIMEWGIPQMTNMAHVHCMLDN
jgi:hypothetical protein